MIRYIVKHFDYKEEDIAKGKYDAWDLILPFWNNVNIFEGLETYNKDTELLTDAQRRFIALQWYDSEVCNGGHDQFFRNSSGIVWKDALEGMKMIGDEKGADNLQKAVEIFGGSIPFDYFERRKALEKIYEIYGMKAFDEIDDEFIGGDLFEKLMNEYLISHPNEFVVDGDYQYSEFVR